jgi:putative SOS response-associated peptidase YedK
MCGRFTLRASAQTLATLFDVAEVPPLQPRYNIAPSQPIAAVRMQPGRSNREFTFLSWGLIPSWAKDIKIGYKMINARAETAATKPSFRAAFKYRRCIVPADGFYEWQKVNGRKQPYFVHMKHDGPFGIAGLWERWEGPDGSVIESATLLTTGPNELMKPLHNRMPVILHPDDYELWLDPSVKQSPLLDALLKPFPAEEMDAFPVSTYVNSPQFDEPLCVEPIAGKEG